MEVFIREKTMDSPGYPRLTGVSDFPASHLQREMTTQTQKSIRCPNCRKPAPWEGNPFRPFCSERCRMIDLGAWVAEEYRIPAEGKQDEEEESE
jgi:uncharacterized protein